MKSLTEQIEEQERKKAQLEAKIKQLKARNAEAERKARTHRLIETGAIVESSLGIQLTTSEQKQKFTAVMTRYADVLLAAINTPIHGVEEDDPDPDYISLF